MSLAGSCERGHCLDLTKRLEAILLGVRRRIIRTMGEQGVLGWVCWIPSPCKNGMKRGVAIGSAALCSHYGEKEMTQVLFSPRHHPFSS